MKRIIAFASCLLMGMSICGCTSKIDYSDNQYIGAAGSEYSVAVTDSNYVTQVMVFLFNPDGTGGWGYASTARDDVLGDTFHYTISGGVNVSFTEDTSGGKGSGYFTTFSDSGQCFVTSGLIFYRIQ